MTRPGRRGTAASRGYGAAWQKARLGYLRRHPLCALCAKQGRTTQATVVDHIIPHRGDQRLFWDAAGNWQPLCKPCHDRKTGAGERILGCDVDGRPLDPNHPWARRG